MCRPCSRCCPLGIPPIRHPAPTRACHCRPERWRLNKQWPLGASLAISLAWHLLILAVWPAWIAKQPRELSVEQFQFPAFFQVPRKSLQVRLRQSAETQNLMPNAAVRPPGGNGHAGPPSKAGTLARQAAAVAKHGNHERLPAPSTPASPTPSASLQRPDQGPASGWLEAARAHIRHEGAIHSADPMAAPPKPHQEASPLARALAPRSRKIEQLAGGVVRVTNANGERYCLQAIPDVVNRDLPHPATSVPMLCP